VTAIGRAVAAGATANLAMGTLFAWSLVAEQAAADVGATGTTTSAVFATAIATFAGALLAVGRLDPQPAPRFVLVAAAAAAGSGLGLARRLAASRHAVVRGGSAVRRGQRAGLRGGRRGGRACSGGATWGGERGGGGGLRGPFIPVGPADRSVTRPAPRRTRPQL